MYAKGAVYPKYALKDESLWLRENEVLGLDMLKIFSCGEQKEQGWVALC